MLGQAIALAQFGLFSAVSSNPALLASFGFRDDQPVLINLILFTYLLSPLDEVRLLPWECALGCREVVFRASCL